ncbi:hypothetical protein [Streptomyces adelaidensis]|uniref:hypothetical protein n=1 Tax=Streptomyces adelaidensis TaxID=2796465 RepID=UPI001907F4CA|nr:hypothetical protein [Streptomyces adelaidensis]
MKDLLPYTLALGISIGAVVIAYCLFDRYRNKRPYLAARWDDTAGDWVNEAEHDVGPDGLLLLEDLTAHLRAYGTSVADLYEPATNDHQGD